MPARLFAADPDGARERALDATLASLDSVLAEPIARLPAARRRRPPVRRGAHPARPRGRARMPGGNIFHRDLAWPFAETEAEVGTWGVETDDPRLLSAARARAAAAGSAACRAATRRWPCWGAKPALVVRRRLRKDARSVPEGARGRGRRRAPRTVAPSSSMTSWPRSAARRYAENVLGVSEAAVAAQRGAVGGPQVIPVQRTAHAIASRNPCTEVALPGLVRDRHRAELLRVPARSTALR